MPVPKLKLQKASEVKEIRRKSIQVYTMDSYEERAPQNESSGDAVNLDFCNELTDRELQFLDFSVFWIEGFALCVFALFGIIANIISVIILSK